MHCKMTTTVKLVDIFITTSHDCVCGENNEIYSDSKFEAYNIVNHSHRAVHWIPRTYSSCIKESVSFDQPPCFPLSSFQQLLFVLLS